MSDTPCCEICGKTMTKILVDLEEEGTVMTAYECPDHQTLADLKVEPLDELPAAVVLPAGISPECAPGNP